MAKRLAEHDVGSSAAGQARSEHRLPDRRRRSSAGRGKTAACRRSAPGSSSGSSDRRLSMSMQPNAPISRHAIRAACALGTTPLTIKTTMSTRQNSACGALPGRRKHLVEFGRQVEDDQIVGVGPQPLDVRPGADQEQRVADPERFVQQPVFDGDTAVPQPDHGQPVARAEPGVRPPSCRRARSRRTP